MMTIARLTAIRQFPLAPGKRSAIAAGPSARPSCEFMPGWDLIALEDRTLLSSVNWTNATGGDWDTGSNWSTGSVPGAVG